MTSRMSVFDPKRTTGFSLGVPHFFTGSLHRTKALAAAPARIARIDDLQGARRRQRGLQETVEVLRILGKADPSVALILSMYFVTTSCDRTDRRSRTAMLTTEGSRALELAY